MRLYIGNIPWRLTEEDIIGAFSAYGVREETAKIIRDRETGRSRGYGFIEVDRGAEAIGDMNGRDIGGRALKVSEALRDQNRR